MTDRKLARGAVAALAVLGILLLAIAGATDGYWQALLINLGTGVLLFVALEHALYGPAERLTALVTSIVQPRSAALLLEMSSSADIASSQARQALARRVQATAPLPAARLAELESQLQYIEQTNWGEDRKGISYLVMLADHYGEQPVRQAITSEPRGGASATDPPTA